MEPHPLFSPALEMTGISKFFGPFAANRQVDFQVMEGEFHALLGENGAGKSTLMNILSGRYRPDRGTIRLHGKEVSFRSPSEALKHRIGMVYQNFKLIENLTVFENILLGYARLFKGKEIKKRIAGYFQTSSFRKEAMDRIVSISHSYGLKVDPSSYVWQISMGERQRVEIVKVLCLDATLLVLDEPTAVLTPQESDSLFYTLQKLKESGSTIIFITHKLREVNLHAQRVTIMRKGRVVGTYPTRELNAQRMASLMVGEEFDGSLSMDTPSSGETGRKISLEIRSISCRGEKGVDVLDGLSLEAQAGEILGVAGIAGNGQEAMAECIMGLRVPYRGEIWFDGKRLDSLSPKEIMGHKIAYIPADRLGTAVAPTLSIQENLGLKKCVSSGFFLPLAEIGRNALAQIKEFNIQCTSPETPAQFLSGGNLQKLILAREISSSPELVIAVYPTRGLDVSATRFVQEALLGLKRQGKTILYISEDLDEVFLVSDRIAVIRGGKIVSVEEKSRMDKIRIGLLMTGGTS